MSVAEQEKQDVEMSDPDSTFTNGNQTYQKLSDHMTENSPSTLSQTKQTTTTDESTNTKDLSIPATLPKMPPMSINSTVSSESESTKSSHSTSPPVKHASLNGQSKSPMVNRINTPAKSFTSPSTTLSVHKLTQSTQSAMEIIKSTKEAFRLKEVLEGTSASAAQKVLREEWRKFLFEGFHLDSGDHISFILRAILKNVKWSPRLINVVLNDPTVMGNILEEPMTIPNLLSTVTYTQLVEHVPTAALDQALAERLKNVEAVKLVRWLSEANRLGYKSDDILDEEDESVRPNGPGSYSDEPEILHVEPVRPASNIPIPAIPAIPAMPPQQQRDPLLAEQERNLLLMGKQAAASKRQKVPTGGPIGSCPNCDADFKTMSGYSYHLYKKPCLKEAPDKGWKLTCENCKQGFTQQGGYKYHLEKGVCNSGVSPSTNPSQSQQSQIPSPAALPAQSQGNPVYPPIRPPIHSQAPHQTFQTPIPSHQGPPPLSRPPINKPAPSPVSTPTSVPKGTRRLVSDLSPVERARLDAELSAEEARYARVKDDINKAYKDSPAELAQRLQSAKNGHNTKMSVIRKAHGATLRMRQGDKDLRKMDTPPSGKTGPTPSFSPVNGSSSGSRTVGMPSAPPPILPPMSERPPMFSSNYQALPNNTQGPSTSVGYRQSIYHGNAGPSNGYTGPYQNQPSNKRRRSQDDDHGSPRPNGPNHDVPRPQPWFASPKGRNVSAPQPTGPGLAMMEMSSEDAAAKYTGTRKPGRQSHGGSVRSPASAPRPVHGSGARNAVIVLTDTDSDNDITARAPPVPEPKAGLAASIEKDDNEMEDIADDKPESESDESDVIENTPGGSRRLSGMRAKRGGHH